MYLAVFFGGALGCLAREITMPLIPVLGATTSSLAANIVACFIIGWLYAIRHKVHQQAIYFGAVGFCGGLSTFSTFTADLFFKTQSGQIGQAATAAAIEIVVGLSAAIIGEMVGRHLHSKTAQ